MGPLRCSGRTRTPSLSSPTTLSGASVLQVQFALWHSTSASGPSRRVPPPRGSPPRCPSRAFPSKTVSSSLCFFYEAFPHSEVRCLWTILWCGPLFPSSLRTCSLRHSPMRGGYFFWGRRMCFPSAVKLAYCHRFQYVLSFTYSFRLRTGAVGRVSRPRSSTWRSSLFSISSLFLLASSRIACNCSLMTLVLGISMFKFSSGVVSRSTGVERLVVVSPYS